MQPLPTPDGIIAAAQAVREVVQPMPLLENPVLNRRLGGRLLLKTEIMHTSGAFKIRGAYTWLKRNLLSAPRPVIACSSGNHGLAVAQLAQRFGLDATIVTPADAPKVKKQGIEDAGATLIVYDRARENRERIAQQRAQATGGVVIHPFDDVDVIEGQGTVGDEIMNEARAAGYTIDQIAVPCGGGGLTAGIATMFIGHSTQVIPVEVPDFDGMARSLKAGILTAAPGGRSSICDGVLPLTPSALTLVSCQAADVQHTVLIDEVAVRAAVRTIFTYFHLAVEPSGAMGLAAVLAGKIDPCNKTTVVVCTGGNVDPALFGSIINGN
ncbi:MAG: threonine/serine dehydratase [Pseudomonadota bacterium]